MEVFGSLPLLPLACLAGDINELSAEVERVLKICTQVQVQVVPKIILDYKQKYWC